MKLDMHMHTHYSPDSLIKPEDAVRRALKLGLSGIAVTDHNTFEGAEKTYRIAKTIDLDFMVVKGCEIETELGEVLALFINEEIKERKFVEVVERVRECNGLLALPHPFDRLRKSRFHGDFEEAAKVISAVEVFNARVLFGQDNRKALAYAVGQNKAKLAGSDAHFLFELGNGITEAGGSTEEELKEAIKKAQTTASGKSALPFVHGPTKLVRMFRRYFEHR
ncbi:MAG: PHP domain-containing protein [Candidatus Micrarchaeota archaeon]